MSRKEFKRSAARAPAAVAFIGTIFHEKKSGDQSQEEKARAQTREKLAAANKDCFDAAIALLSQSPTGRDLLKQVNGYGYRFVFDDRRTGDRDAGGLCDPQDKLIILRANDDPEYLALLIGHEAVHAVQNSRFDLFPSTRHRPDAGIMVSFAIEADAYAQMTQIALELAHGEVFGKANVPGPLVHMRLRYPELVQAAERALKTGKEKTQLENGACVAAAFNAFYGSDHLRLYYEESHLAWLEEISPRLSNKDMSWRFNDNGAPEKLKSQLLHRGKPYLETHAPDLSLDAARHSGLTQPCIDAITVFYARFLPFRKLPFMHVHQPFNGLSARKDFQRKKPAPLKGDPPPRDFWPKDRAANQNKKKAKEPHHPARKGQDDAEKPSKIKAPRKRKRDFW